MWPMKANGIIPMKYLSTGPHTSRELGKCYLFVDSRL